ncbi:MAG TPA: hypothetical protein PLI95_10965 [Polyangiaceae bacterium]|nr:hypothetical protein [Polyangiaceae bacterium]
MRETSEGTSPVRAALREGGWYCVAPRSRSTNVSTAAGAAGLAARARATYASSSLESS